MPNNRLNNNEYKSLNESVQRMNEGGAREWRGVDGEGGKLPLIDPNLTDEEIQNLPDPSKRFSLDPHYLLYRLIRWLMGD